MRLVIVRLVLVGVLVYMGVLTVIVVPEEVVGIFLRVTALLLQVFHRGLEIGLVCITIDTCELTQPVLMTGRVAFVEVSDLTLRLSGDEISLERQTDTYPSLRTTYRCCILAPIDTYIVAWNTLVPHQVVGIELVADWCVEVLLINQEVVVRCCQVALYEVT